MVVEYSSTEQWERVQTGLCARPSTQTYHNTLLPYTGESMGARRDSGSTLGVYVGAREMAAEEEERRKREERYVQ